MIVKYLRHLNNTLCKLWTLSLTAPLKSEAVSTLSVHSMEENLFSDFFSTQDSEIKCVYCTTVRHRGLWKKNAPLAHKKGLKDHCNLFKQSECFFPFCCVLVVLCALRGRLPPLKCILHVLAKQHSNQHSNHKDRSITWIYQINTIAALSGRNTAIVYALKQTNTNATSRNSYCHMCFFVRN